MSKKAKMQVRRELHHMQDDAGRGDLSAQRGVKRWDVYVAKGITPKISWSEFDGWRVDDPLEMPPPRD